MVFPSFSGLSASRTAAQSAAPDEMPVRIPSFLVSSFDASNAASSSIRITSSYMPVSSTSGIKPAPIPCI